MRYYTTSEVAKQCKVHRNTVLTAIRKGVLRIHRTPGGHARISQDDLDEFIHRRSLPSSSGRGAHKVLIVDDDSVFNQIAGTTLSNAGFVVRVATTGFEAGMLLAEFHPDAVVLDIMLPDIRGDVVCRRIRATPALADTAVLGISASHDKALVDRILKAGADDFIAKPISPETLLARLMQMLDAAPASRNGR